MKQIDIADLMDRFEAALNNEQSEYERSPPVFGEDGNYDTGYARGLWKAYRIFIDTAYLYIIEYTGETKMKLTTTEVLFLIASVSAMALIGEGDDNTLICDYITEKLYQYNQEYNDIPVPDPIHPECFKYPEDMKSRIIQAVNVYKTEVIEHILQKLCNHDNIKEETVE